MIGRIADVAAVCTAVGSGLVAGLLLAFSAGVMTALGRLPPAQGMAAMQAINLAIPNPLFGLVFGGTAVASVVLAVTAPLAGRGAWPVAAALLYLVGTFALTLVVNVPMNNVLAAADPTGQEAPARWASYRTRWTAWNHVRTAAATAAAVVLTLSA